MNTLRAALLAALLLIPSIAAADVIDPEEEKREEQKSGCSVSQSYTTPQSAAALALGALALVGAARRRQRA